GALVEDVGEEITEGRRCGSVDADRKVKSLEAVRRSHLHARRGSRGVVAAAAFRIAQRLVRFRDLPELLRRQPVTRVDVRMVPPRQPLVGPLDVVQRRATLDAEQNVEIHWQFRICSAPRNRYDLSSTTSASITSPVFSDARDPSEPGELCEPCGPWEPGEPCEPCEPCAPCDAACD